MAIPTNGETTAERERERMSMESNKQAQLTVGNK